MNILLTAVNAKFIHSNPAVYSLRACVKKDYRQFIDLAEYTINNKTEEILADIYNRKPDVIAFSCYIWNREIIDSLITELPKVLPDICIWLGGPEASYDAEGLLKKYQALAGVMIGEGEETFNELVEYYCLKADALPSLDGNIKDISQIDGIAYRCTDTDFDKNEVDKIIFTRPRRPADMSALPFLYEELSCFENRIIYYESSRGCPYRCSYCLSSIDKTVRLRDISVVKKELRFFLDNKVKQVKFVDRTFNCNKDNALEIWKFLSENDNGVTNFHFEIAADILTDDEMEVLSGMRPGLVQLEIGVQTTNTDTLKEIRRINDIDKIRRRVAEIKENGNIHVHLDLIAGLPYEGYESFKNSFNNVYEMKPDELQLGFLKVLKGSYMYEKAGEYGLKYTDSPPYEVLSTKWLSYAEVLRLKRIEEMLELYYNSDQFDYTLSVILNVFENAFAMYEALAAFYAKKGYLLMTPSRIYRYDVLLEFAMETELADKKEMIEELLTFDLYLRENIKRRPEFAKNLTIYKTQIRHLYEQEEKDRKTLPGYQDHDARQLGKMTHMEVFNYPVWEKEPAKRMERLDEPCMVLFDYKDRSPVTHAAKFFVFNLKL